ncbi:MAG: hypothetical protein CUN57_02420, partial [Phototrophicales bacterium]
MLYLDYPLLDTLQLWRQDGKTEPKLMITTGDSLPLDSRPMRHRAFAFPFHLDKEETTTLYLVANSRDTLQFPLSIYTADAFSERVQLDYYIFGFYFGAVLIMSVFVLCLFINFKDLTLIYMSVYL